MPDLNMRAADPCPTNNEKRAKHSKILKPGCFFVFTPFYQWTNSVLCDARSLYGMRCADLYGLVAFARYAARSLYGMRCADLCGLVVFARCAARSLYCAMRCAVVVRDAMRRLVEWACDSLRELTEEMEMWKWDDTLDNKWA